MEPIPTRLALFIRHLSIRPNDAITNRALALALERAFDIALPSK
jgi:hypothetical protein